MSAEGTPNRYASTPARFFPVEEGQMVTEAGAAVPVEAMPDSLRAGESYRQARAINGLILAPVHLAPGEPEDYHREYLQYGEVKHDLPGHGA